MNGSDLYFDQENRMMHFINLVKVGSGRVASLVTTGSAKILERLDPKDVYKGDSIQRLREHLAQKGQLDHYKCSLEELKLYLQLVKSGVNQYDFQIDSDAYKLLGKINYCFLNTLGLDTSKEISMQLDLIEAEIDRIPENIFLAPNMFLRPKQVLTILENNPDLLLKNFDKFSTSSETRRILFHEGMTFEDRMDLLRRLADDRMILISYSHIRSYFR
jgi:hypothetical protein